MNKLTVLALASSFLVTACLLPINTRGAQEAQARHYQRMCADPNFAYETGNNDGMKRRPLDTQWVQYHCAPQFQNDVRTAYQNGYQMGIQNAPIVVEGRGFGGGRGGYYSAAQTCTFSSDCGGDGYSCRADASGTKVCMGYGSQGDACWFGSDCLSGSCSGRVCR